jgi:preprotein translocase subunit SecD
MRFSRGIPSAQLDKLTITLEPGQSALLASPQTPIYPLDAVRGRYGAEPLRVAPGRYPLFAKVGLYALVGGISDRTRTDGKQLELQSGSIPIEVLQSAKMQFRKVSEFTETRTREVVAQDPASHVLELADLNGKKEVVLDDSTEVLIDEEDLESAVAVPDENNPPFYLIDLTLKSEIAPWFFKQTQELCDRPLDKPLLGIFINGKLISAPKLNSPIGAKANITGRYTKEQAEELAKQLCKPAGENCQRRRQCMSERFSLASFLHDNCLLL